MVDFSPVFSKIDQNKERSNRRSFLWNSIFWNIHEKEGNKCRMSVNPSRMESYQCFTHKLREMRVNVKSVFVEGWLEEHVLRLVTREANDLRRERVSHICCHFRQSIHTSFKPKAISLRTCPSAMWLSSTSSHVATESQIWDVWPNSFSDVINAIDAVVIYVR